jgi:hypothetical protein
MHWFRSRGTQNNQNTRLVGKAVQAAFAEQRESLYWTALTDHRKRGIGTAIDCRCNRSC